MSKSKLSLKKVLSAIVVAACVFAGHSVVADAGSSSSGAAGRARKCRHIAAVDPFPGKNDYSILYPHISEITMRTHFHSHQVAGYVGRLNAWLKGAGGTECPTDEASLLLHFVRDLGRSDPLRNAAHQAYNHALYFAMLRKNRTLVEVRPSADDAAGYVRVSDGVVEEVGTTDGNGDNGEEGETAEVVTIHGQTYVDRSHKYNIMAQPRLRAALAKAFGSVAAFKEAFVARATGHFASGWVWLMVDPADGSLSIAETHDGDTVNGGHTPASYAATLDALTEATLVESQGGKTAKTAEEDEEANAARHTSIQLELAKDRTDPSTIDGRVPLAVLDVWEHAYYLDYQSRRKEYAEAWLRAVDWSLVERRMGATDFELPKREASPEKDYTYSVFY